jgi:hypothetical protein
MAQEPSAANTAAWPAAMLCLGAATEMPPPGSFCSSEDCPPEPRCGGVAAQRWWRAGLQQLGA